MTAGSQAFQPGFLYKASNFFDKLTAPPKAFQPKELEEFASFNKSSLPNCDPLVPKLEEAKAKALSQQNVCLKQVQQGNQNPFHSANVAAAYMLYNKEPVTPNNRVTKAAANLARMEKNMGDTPQQKAFSA